MHIHPTKWLWKNRIKLIFNYCSNHILDITSVFFYFKMFTKRNKIDNKKKTHKILFFIINKSVTANGVSKKVYEVNQCQNWYFSLSVNI